MVVVAVVVVLAASKMDFEIVGLLSDTNGRSCTLHGCCGEHVQVGDTLRLVACVVTIKDEPENAIKVVKMEDAIDSCTVGFVPRVQATLPKVKSHLNKFVQVVELYMESTSPYKRAKSHGNRGMASVAFLHDETRDE